MMMRLIQLAVISVVAAAREDKLEAGDVLAVGDCLRYTYLGEAQYTACLTNQGQLSVTDSAGSVLFETPKAGRNTGYQAKLESGALKVMISKKGKDDKDIWSSGTSTGDYLQLRNDGALALFNQGYIYDSLEWSSPVSGTEPIMVTAQGSAAESSAAVEDPATGVTFARHGSFGKGGSIKAYCMGAGVRAKALVVANVNVYSAALYVEPKGAAKALASFSGTPSKTLANSKNFYGALMQPGFAKFVQLKFVRSVGAQKIVDALTAISDVSAEALESFSSMLLGGIGGAIKSGETITLGWSSKDVLLVSVRGKPLGEVKDAKLPAAVFDLYLGDAPVSPAAKAAWAAGVEGLMASEK